jgi:hypothetical protein
MKLTPYQRIVRAADQGKGVRLTAHECIDLSLDHAIEQRALMDDEEQDEQKTRLQQSARVAHEKAR